MGILLIPCDKGFHITITNKEHLPVANSLNNVFRHTNHRDSLHKNNLVNEFQLSLAFNLELPHFIPLKVWTVEGI
jgi:hypothetical protein